MIFIWCSWDFIGTYSQHFNWTCLEQKTQLLHHNMQQEFDPVISHLPVRHLLRSQPSRQGSRGMCVWPYILENLFSFNIVRRAKKTQDSHLGVHCTSGTQLSQVMAAPLSRQLKHMIFLLGLFWVVQLVNLLEMNMMQFWHVLLPKRAAASSARLSFCLALTLSLSEAHEVFTSLISASQLPNCLRASLTPNLKFKAGSARRCHMQVFRQTWV